MAPHGDDMVCINLIVLQEWDTCLQPDPCTGLQIMECLGGDALWFDRCAGLHLLLAVHLQTASALQIAYGNDSRDGYQCMCRFIAAHAAIVYYWLLLLLFWVKPEAVGTDSATTQCAPAGNSAMAALRVMKLHAEKQKLRAVFMCRHTHFLRCWNRTQSTPMVRHNLNLRAKHVYSRHMPQPDREMPKFL
jgi:hypothetical protein